MDDDAGDDPDSCRRRSRAICSLDARRARPSATRRMRHVDAVGCRRRLKPPPPPACAMTVSASGTSSGTMLSSRMRDLLGALDARADRQLRVTLTLRPRRSAASARSRSSAGSARPRRRRAVPTPTTVGRCCERLVDQAAVARRPSPSRNAFARRVQASAEARALLDRRRQLQQPRAEHRHDRDRHEQRHRQREHHDDRQLLEQDARDAGQEEQRHEHGDVRQRRREDRRPDFLAAVDRRRASGPCRAPCAGTCSRARRSRRRRSCRRRAPGRRRSSCSACSRRSRAARTCRRPRSESTCRR